MKVEPYKKYIETINKLHKNNTRNESTYEDIINSFLLPNLNYKESNYNQQKRVKGKRLDFLLEVADNPMPIEVKLFEVQKSRKFTSGRSQLARYLKSNNWTIGILTDSFRWELIKIHENYNQYRIIWSYEIINGGQSQQSANRRFITALGKFRINNFMQLANKCFSINSKSYGDVAADIINNNYKQFGEIKNSEKDLLKDLVINFNYIPKEERVNGYNTNQPKRKPKRKNQPRGRENNLREY